MKNWLAVLSLKLSSSQHLSSASALAARNREPCLVGVLLRHCIIVYFTTDSRFSVVVLGVVVASIIITAAHL